MIKISQIQAKIALLAAFLFQLDISDVYRLTASLCALGLVAGLVSIIDNEPELWWNRV